MIKQFVFSFLLGMVWLSGANAQAYKVNLDFSQEQRELPQSTVKGIIGVDN